MQNLTAKGKNLTDWQCDLCSHSFLYYLTIPPYFLVSLPTNGLVLWRMISSSVFWTDKMEVCEFHLVLTEMLLVFLGPPLLTIKFFVNKGVEKAVFKLINVMFIARVQFQNSISIERYFAVLRPVLYRRYKPLRYRMSFCCVIWLVIILASVPQMIICDGDLKSLVMYRIYFFLVFFFNLFCCSSILRALKQPSPGGGERQGSNLIKKRAFKIVLIFQVTAFVGYLPLATVYSMVQEIDRDTLCIWQSLAYSVMVWLGVIYPLLYLRRAA